MTAEQRMRRVLVIGRSGQLASELARASAPGLEVACVGRETLDLAALDAIDGVLTAQAPNAVINAAAYTAVDKAEEEPDLAFRINRDAPHRIAAACAARGVPLVHVSTDYVFAGDKAGAYVESDPVAPLSVYGRSKAEGEAHVLSAHGGACVIRTSWLYSPFGTNFLKTMLRLGETRSEIGVVADQHGRPTAARDLAAACLLATERLLSKDASAAGVFHFAGGGEASWADFAEAIFAEASKRGRAPVRVRRIASADYPVKARRPANSRLDTAKFERVFGHRPRPWREALSVCLDELL